MTRRLIATGGWVLGVGLSIWVFPLFHVVPLGRARDVKEQASFNAPRFAEAFWDEQLMTALPSSAEARTVLDAIERDFPAAREKYGRTVGIGDSYYVFIRGTGRILSEDSRGVSLAIRDDPASADVVLLVGMLFGNTVRDATGLLNMNAFPNSQDFNDIAVNLNRIVETRVLPALRAGSRVGREVRFVGCALVERDERQRKPLKVVPLSVDFSQPSTSESSHP